MEIIVDSAIPFIKDRIKGDVSVKFIPGNDFSRELVKDADALIVRTRTKCDENLLGNSKVKLIATATIGTDHIDIPWCRSKNIVVRSAPGCNAPGVAQYVLSSLFHSGFNPHKDTLGIIGYGNVGSLIGEWARSMGIKILVNDPPLWEQGKDMINLTSLEEILKNSDAVTLHVPFKKSGKYPTYKLIGKNELQEMKPGAILINSSRGGVVDEQELKKAIKKKDIRAVIDVWENEPDIDKTLAEMALIATPHIAGYSEEGKKRATRMVLESLNKDLNIRVNLSGLECLPPLGKEISKELIENSYNPVEDKKKLLADVSKFEKLRNEYYYRHEPLFF